VINGWRRLFATLDFDRWWLNPWLAVPIALSVPVVLIVTWRSFHRGEK
jgi:uncharacterized membrane protein